MNVIEYLAAIEKNHCEFLIFEQPKYLNEGQLTVQFIGMRIMALHPRANFILWPFYLDSDKKNYGAFLFFKTLPSDSAIQQYTVIDTSASYDRLAKFSLRALKAKFIELNRGFFTLHDDHTLFSHPEPYGDSEKKFLFILRQIAPVSDPVKEIPCPTIYLPEITPMLTRSSSRELVAKRARLGAVDLYSPENINTLCALSWSFLSKSNPPRANSIAIFPIVSHAMFNRKHQGFSEIKLNDYLAGHDSETRSLYSSIYDADHLKKALKKFRIIIFPLIIGDNTTTIEQDQVARNHYGLVVLLHLSSKETKSSRLNFYYHCSLDAALADSDASNPVVSWSRKNIFSDFQEKFAPLRFMQPFIPLIDQHSAMNIAPIPEPAHSGLYICALTEYLLHNFPKGHEPSQWMSRINIPQVREVHQDYLERKIPYTVPCSDGGYFVLPLALE